MNFLYQTIDVINHFSLTPRETAGLIDACYAPSDSFEYLKENSTTHSRNSVLLESLPKCPIGNYQAYLSWLVKATKQIRISYPDGYETLREFSNRNPSENSHHDDDSFGKDDALCVDFTTQFDKTKSQKLKVFIEFKKISFTKPRNRLCGKFGSENFIIVKMNFPKFHLEDIIRHLRDESSADDEDEDYNEIRKRLLLYLLGENIENLKKKEREFMYKKIDNDQLRQVLKNPIKIHDKEFVFLCCSITGALTQKFVFVNREIVKQIQDWGFASDEFNESKVFLTDRPMVFPLRISLLNSLGVPTCILKNYEVKDDIHVGSVNQTDGSGVILSMKFMRNSIEEYKKNFFQVCSSDQDEEIEEHEYEFSNKYKQPKGLSNDLPNMATLKDYIPSVIQIRQQGFKGMLTYYKNPNDLVFYQEMDQPESYPDVIFTKSMKKFSCPEKEDVVLDTLYIVGMSKPAQKVILSSELIHMFSGLCPDEEKLLKYLKELLLEKRADISHDSILSLFNDKQKIEKLLKRRGDEKGLAALSSGVLPFKIAFLGSETFHSYLLHLNVPMKNSAYLYGVPDFTGTLKEGEVFVQITGQKPLECNIIATKTPSMYRSDIQGFRAVYNSKLDGIQDVLVFSTQGPSFAPSLMSNADLDGDHFYIFWDKDLVSLINIGKSREPNLNNSIPEDSGDSASEETSHTNLESIDNLLEDTVEQKLQRAIDSLLLPINSFEYCSFTHLLEIRRKCLEHYGNGWGLDEQNYLDLYTISNAINSTFDAPKHGNWIKWKEILPKLKITPNLLQPYSSNNSIIKILYDSLLCEVSGSKSTPSKSLEITRYIMLCSVQRAASSSSFEKKNFYEHLDSIMDGFQKLNSADQILSACSFAILFYDYLKDRTMEWNTISKELNFYHNIFYKKGVSAIYEFMDKPREENSYNEIERSLSHEQVFENQTGKIRFPKLYKFLVGDENQIDDTYYVARKEWLSCYLPFEYKKFKRVTKLIDDVFYDNCDEDDIEEDGVISSQQLVEFLNKKLWSHIFSYINPANHRPIRAVCQFFNDLLSQCEWKSIQKNSMSSSKIDILIEFVYERYCWHPKHLVYQQTDMLFDETVYNDRDWIENFVGQIYETLNFLGWDNPVRDNEYFRNFSNMFYNEEENSGMDATIYLQNREGILRIHFIYKYTTSTERPQYEKVILGLLEASNFLLNNTEITCTIHKISDDEFVKVHKVTTQSRLSSDITCARYIEDRLEGRYSLPFNTYTQNNLLILVQAIRCTYWKLYQMIDLIKRSEYEKKSLLDMIDSINDFAWPTNDIYNIQQYLLRFSKKLNGIEDSSDPIDSSDEEISIIEEEDD